MSNLTTLDLSWNRLGEHAVGVCGHLSKLPNLTTFDISVNDLGQHAVGVCRTFLTPIAPITLTLTNGHDSNDVLSDNILIQCRQVAQENLDLRKKDKGVVWLNSLFCKKEQVENVKKEETSKVNQTEEPLDQQRVVVKLFDIPNPLIQKVLDSAWPVAPLKIRCQ